MEILKFFKKINANNKRFIKIFVNKILHIKPINNKKEIVKQNTDEFKYEGDTQTSDVEEIENETEGNDDNDDDGNDDDGGGFNDNGDDDNNDDDRDVDFDNDDDGDSGDDDNCVDGATVNGDDSNIKHLIGET